MNESDVIHTARQVREQSADPLARLAVLLELPLGSHDPPLIAMPAAAVRAHGDGPAVEWVKCWLVIEGIDLAWAAVHEQKDDALGLRREMRLPWRQGIGRVRWASG